MLILSEVSWKISCASPLLVISQRQVGVVFIREIVPLKVCNLDDILHARIRTMGVAEHVFDVSLHGRTVTWHLYDVGGARGQRHTWVPYFDDA